MQINLIIYLVLFYALMMFLQIFLLNKVDIDSAFLKRKIELSSRLSFLIVLFTALVLSIIFYLYFQLDYLSKTLYFFSSLFILNGFLTTFILLKSKNTVFRLLTALTVICLLLSISLFLESMILKNIITAISFLWIAPFFYKQLKISKAYIFIFFIAFTIVDFYNILIIKPVFITHYYTVFLNGFVEFNQIALGVGDFLLSYLAVGFIWLYRGNMGAVLLTVLISSILFIVSLIGFDHPVPFSISIVIPMFIVYFCGIGKIKLQIT